MNDRAYAMGIGTYFKSLKPNRVNSRKQIVRDNRSELKRELDTEGWFRSEARKRMYGKK